MSKVILFSPPNQDGGPSDQNVMKLKVQLDSDLANSRVYKNMKKDYYQNFSLLVCESQAEVERALKQDDFLQSWIVIFANEHWDSIPMMHRELINTLWHPHSRLETKVYSPMLIVWGYPNHMGRSQTWGGPLPLKDQYESNLHVTFCTTLEEVVAQFRRVQFDGDDANWSE
mmetsp:Transcript_11678/g.21125  ORF Transcript_11678/g.21125 Transcript_11678/m.21125 type:complete len:171 (-) Transcript_11678:139-651(-)